MAHACAHIVVDELIKELNAWREKVMNMLWHRKVQGVDVVVLVYQDYIKLDQDVYRLSAVIQ